MSAISHRMALTPHYVPGVNAIGRCLRQFIERANYLNFPFLYDLLLVAANEREIESGEVDRPQSYYPRQIIHWLKSKHANRLHSDVNEIPWNSVEAQLLLDCLHIFDEDEKGGHFEYFVVWWKKKTLL